MSEFVAKEMTTNKQNYTECNLCGVFVGMQFLFSLHVYVAEAVATAT